MSQHDLFRQKPETEREAMIRRLYALADAGDRRSPKSSNLRQIAGDLMRRLSNSRQPKT